MKKYVFYYKTYIYDMSKKQNMFDEYLLFLKVSNTGSQNLNYYINLQ